MSEPTPEFVLYDTPEQGMALVLLNGASGYKICGAPELYGQQTEVARFPTDERTRREVRERLADPDPDDPEGLVEVAWMPADWRERLNDGERQTIVGATKHPDGATEWAEVEIRPTRRARGDGEVGDGE